MTATITRTQPGCLKPPSGKISVTNHIDGIWLKVDLVGDFVNPAGEAENCTGSCEASQCRCHAEGLGVVVPPNSTQAVSCNYPSCPSSEGCTGCGNTFGSCSGSPFCNEEQNVRIEVVAHSCDGTTWAQQSISLPMRYTRPAPCGTSEPVGDPDWDADLDAGVEEWLCACRAVPVGTNINRLLDVGTYPGVPGRTFEDGTLALENTSTQIDLRMDVDNWWENKPPGGSDCAGCTPVAEGCGACEACEACIVRDAIEVTHGNSIPLETKFPGCDAGTCEDPEGNPPIGTCHSGPRSGLPCLWSATPGLIRDRDCRNTCDNAKCLTGPNAGHHCQSIVDCNTPGNIDHKCDIGGFTTSILCYHCTDVAKGCVSGPFHGEACASDATCSGGTCVDARAVKIDLREFKCVGQQAWTVNRCSGRSRAGYGCTVEGDCPPGGGCTSMSVRWTEIPEHFNTPKSRTDLQCPDSACP